MKYSAQNYLKHYFWYSAVVMVVVALLCVVLSSSVRGEVAFDDNRRYIMQLVSICTLILIPLAIVYFNDKLEKADKSDMKLFDRQYRSKGIIRSTATALCAIVNAVAYFLIDYKSAIYCVAIGFLAHIYCYPSRKEYDALLGGSSTK